MKMSSCSWLCYAVWFGLLPGAGCAVAQNWTQTSAPITNWQGVACSADGSRLVAVISGGGIYTSTNFGSTWISNAVPSKNWLSVASSADGARLVAVPFNQVPYTSTNSGLTWMTNSGIGNDWHWVASSADGIRLLSAGEVGKVLTSTNGGSSWATNNLPITSWSSVASSTDGRKLVSAEGANLFTSTNFGANWRSNSAPWLFTAVSIAGSIDSSRLLVTSPNGGGVFTSTNFGASWQTNPVPYTQWLAAGSSADGTKLVAAGLYIYTSTNSGLTWVSNSVPSGQWQSVASSADGNRLVAVMRGGGTWTGGLPAQPELSISNVSDNPGIAWAIPSTNFVLEQSTDLVSWVEVTNPPVLDLTNLQYQVMPPLVVDGAFFRLKTP